MHAEDLAMLGELAVGVRELLTKLRFLAQIPPQEDVRDVVKLLNELTAETAQFTDYLQKREVMSWTPERRPRHAPNRWIRPLTSDEETEIRRHG